MTILNDEILNSNAGVILNTIYYSKQDMEAMTDGEVLDLIYHVMDTYAGPDYAKLDIINLILNMSKEN